VRIILVTILLALHAILFLFPALNQIARGESLAWSPVLATAFALFLAAVVPAVVNRNARHQSAKKRHGQMDWRSQLPQDPGYNGLRKRLVRLGCLILPIVAADCWIQTHSLEAAETLANAVSPAEQYQRTLKIFQEGAPAYFQATDERQRQAIVARVDQATTSLLELVEKNPKEQFAVPALTQIITQEYWLNTYTSHPGWGKDSPQARAIALLLRHHLESDQLVETCKRVNFGFRSECQRFLRTVLEKSPHREVQGAACLRLAQFLAGQIEKLDLLKERPELLRRYETLFGKDYIEALQRQDRARAIKEAEALYEQASESYGDVKLPFDETVGALARNDLFEIQHLRIGKVAPEIEAPDQDGRQLKLSDYRGKVVLLYFWSEY
jgi:hypothetical protein